MSSQSGHDSGFSFIDNAVKAIGDEDLDAFLNLYIPEDEAIQLDDAQSTTRDAAIKTVLEKLKAAVAKREAELPLLSPGALKLKSTMRTICAFLFDQSKDPKLFKTLFAPHWYRILGAIDRLKGREAFLDACVACLRSDWLEAFSSQEAWNNYHATCQKLEQAQAREDKEPEAVVYFGNFFGLKESERKLVKNSKIPKELLEMAGYIGETENEKRRIGNHKSSINGNSNESFYATARLYEEMI